MIAENATVTLAGPLMAVGLVVAALAMALGKHHARDSPSGRARAAGRSQYSRSFSVQ